MMWCPTYVVRLRPHRMSSQRGAGGFAEQDSSARSLTPGMPCPFRHWWSQAGSAARRDVHSVARGRRGFPTSMSLSDGQGAL
jgi:hypothetical protein